MKESVEFQLRFGVYTELAAEQCQWKKSIQHY
jgi:hypothetical protein